MPDVILSLMFGYLEYRERVLVLFRRWYKQGKEFDAVECDKEWQLWKCTKGGKNCKCSGGGKEECKERIVPSQQLEGYEADQFLGLVVDTLQHTIPAVQHYGTGRPELGHHPLPSDFPYLGHPETLNNKFYDWVVALPEESKKDVKPFWMRTRGERHSLSTALRHFWHLSKKRVAVVFESGQGRGGRDGIWETVVVFVTPVTTETWSFQSHEKVAVPDLAAVVEEADNEEYEQFHGEEEEEGDAGKHGKKEWNWKEHYPLLPNLQQWPKNYAYGYYLAECNACPFLATIGDIADNQEGWRCTNAVQGTAYNLNWEKEVDTCPMNGDVHRIYYDEEGEAIHDPKCVVPRYRGHCGCPKECQCEQDTVVLTSLFLRSFAYFLEETETLFGAREAAGDYANPEPIRLNYM